MATRNPNLAQRRGPVRCLLTGLLVGTIMHATAEAREPAAFRFSRLQIPGLSHHSVHAVLEDSDGFLWIGTADGLNRFDGSEVLVLRHDPFDPATLSNSSVNVLLEDCRGRLWIGSKDGLDLLERLRLEVRRLAIPRPAGDTAVIVTFAYQDRRGVLWFGTDVGLLRHDPAEPAERYELLRHDANDPGSLALEEAGAVREDHQGKLWVLSYHQQDYASQYLDETGRRFVRAELPEGSIEGVSFLIDTADRLWCNPRGPLQLGPGTVAEQRWLREAPGGVWATLQTADGAIWMGTSHGLARFAPDATTVTQHPLGQAYLENFVRALHQGRSGIVWAGTYGGLYRHDPNAKPFSHLSHDPEDASSLSVNAVSSLVEAADGTLWVGTFGGGLHRLDRRGKVVERLCGDPGASATLPTNVIWNLGIGRSGTLWIGSEEGLYSLDPQHHRISRHWLPGAECFPPVTYLTQDHAGRLWLAGFLGLWRYDPASGASHHYPLAGSPRSEGVRLAVDSLYLDEWQEGTLWIGKADALNRLDLETGAFRHQPLVTAGGISLRGLGTWTIHGEPDALWLGTSVGLLRFDRSTASFSVFTTRHGLPGSVVYSIVADDAGHLWLATNQGLARFDPKTRQVRCYSTADGIGNVEFNRHAACRCASGTIAFGGLDGITLFDPAAIRTNPFVPPVHITRITAWNRDGARTINPLDLDRLVLSYRDSTVAFEVAALSYTNPQQNRYAFRLEGFDNDWVLTGNRRFTQYTNLPPGAYLLRVRGANNDGVWNRQGTSLPVLVTPPYWQTWWFRLLVAAATAALLLAAYRYRLNRKRELERLRLRIAGDLHDDLSSDISGIAVVADMVRRRRYLQDRDRNDLGEISDGALRAAGALRDIVWLIEPDHDSLDATLRRMKSFAATLLRGLQVSFRDNLPGRSVTLDMARRRNLFLVFKEALHNVVCYGGRDLPAARRGSPAAAGM